MVVMLRPRDLAPAEARDKGQEGRKRKWRESKKRGSCQRVCPCMSLLLSLFPHALDYSSRFPLSARDCRVPILHVKKKW